MDSMQLAHVESLCETLYTGASMAGENGKGITRSEAQSLLLSLQTSPEFIPQCQYILDHSKSQYALLVASNALIELLTAHWNSFTVPQRIDIRNYVLAYLANQGPALQDFVVLSLVKLVCRITKLGWFDDATHRELTEDVTKFLQATVNHCVLGLKILNQLVDELNIPTNGRTLMQHRKTSVSFRDLCLFKVFQISLTTLQQLQSRIIAVTDSRQEAILGEQALSLSLKCLNFDFIGTNPDEATTEDVGTIQVPTTWRNLLQEPSTIDLFFHFYTHTDPPQSALAMENIILLSSVRRSLFATDKERGIFLGHLLEGIRAILNKETGMQHQDNYHQFCRLLGRIKANYQLGELVQVEGYVEWLELACNFTVQSVRNWQYCTNSIHYLLALWTRLVAAVPYVRTDSGARGHVQALEKQILTVCEQYITSMLASVELVYDGEGSLDDPLDDDGSLKEQLDRLPTLCRFQYATVANLIFIQFDPLLSQYRDLLTHLGSARTEDSPPDVQKRIAIIEGKLTWLMYIVGCIVGGHSWSSGNLGEGDETIDANLSRRAFQLIQYVDYRLTTSNGIGRACSKLEQAILYYCQSFRRVYMFMWDQNNTTGAVSDTISIVGMITAQLESASSIKQKVYQNMFQHLGMGDHANVANLILTKIGNNLKFWPDENEIISTTLELFLDLATGYSSSKLLISLDSVKFLVRHHTEDYFPFLAVPFNAKHRTTFHAIITRLLLSPSGEEKLELTFEQFLEPTMATLAQLGKLSPNELRNEAIRRPLIGILRDLRGIVSSLHNRKAYCEMFDIIHNGRHLAFFAKVADLWHDQSDVIISLLRFMTEFSQNKANRVNFDHSSANGILLFRCTSDVVCAYGRRLLFSPVTVNASEIYKRRYKCISLALNVMNSALGGGYVCFGVFALYNDPVLDSALDVSLQMILSIPLEDVIAYPKLSKSYFSFVELLFRNHLSTVLSLDTNVLLQLMNAVHEGLQSNDATLSSLCGNAIDHFATFAFENAGKDKPDVHNLGKHLNAQPTIFTSLTFTLFNLLLFGPPQNHWAVMKPMLSILLASKTSLQAYKEHLLSTQSAENQQLLNEAFAALFVDISRSLDSNNRDRFTQKLSAFRVATRGFLTL